MKASQELIDGLRKAAQLVLTENYDWFCHSSCNCGMLAQSLGLPKATLRRQLWTVNCWTDALARWIRERDARCDYLDRDLSEVFEFLFNKGIEPQDIKRIEFMDGDSHHHVPRRVADWFLAQANELEKELKASEVQPEQETTPEQEPERVKVHDTLGMM